MPRTGTKRTHRCPDSHKHALNATCWGNHGCGCDPCREAHRLRINNRRKQIAYGRWEGLIPADEARAHVQLLVAMGWNRLELVRKAGLPRNTFDRIRYGQVQHVHPRVHRAIMALDPGVPEVNVRGFVDGEGTARRLQALVTQGWSGVEIAARLGRHPDHVRRLMTAVWVVKRTRADVARLYDELWDQEPPMETPAQRGTAARVRSRALSRGWVGPLHWDDIDTDPEPVPMGRDTRRADWVIGELDMLREAGESASAAASALRRNVRSVASLAFRYGRPDLGRWLEEAA